MNKTNDKLGFFTFVFLWFGAAVSIAEILTGGLIAPLGFKIGLATILIGHLIGTTIFALGGIIGYREKITAMESTKIAFGSYGSYLFSVLNILQLIGWTAVMIKSSATSINLITKSLWNVDNFIVCALFIGLLTALWIAFGKVGIEKINNIAVMLLFILTLILGFVIFKDGSLLNKTVEGQMTIGGAIELSVVMPLSWLPLIADYTRFAKNEKSAGVGSFLGYFIGSAWMFIIGLASAIISQNSDPSAIMLAVNLGVTALLIVVLSTVTTTFMDVYSAGISFRNITKKLDEKTIGLIMAGIGTVLAIVVQMENYESFLYAIGSVFAPLFAVLITEYFIIKSDIKAKINMKINLGAFLVWVMGVVLYYVFIKFDLIIGATLPVMIITGVLYKISWEVVNKWKLVRE
ncbi:putative hydroxymethylpyrimidine transporter CytX [Clostridium cavendishii DSM 21758]|uniref:Putative hydroxymethylpyrimidine transporter CytX n=1 Tax=Clostridium cavendishii DSM 21758 TaxID=1121302 RepID=A0A1M6EEQ4_9CLOT|nr:putative hydroxymethylpyrimidine transporter CytX [Clostridium cavendishii]SHI83954.1 putative hydroxymethylpyrimidine transporter CytX [Clostridium cavendishii DSM 21758]